MATVYLAEDLKHHRQVAIKVLRPELAAALGSERFLREIETTANLRHPHILPLFDSGIATSPIAQSPNRPIAEYLFYVMPLVEGESLRSRLDREKQLPLEDALRIAREVADALSYAHGRGVIHRDIKPENILLESGHAVVADFGIAKALSAAGGERLTETGLTIGTPKYMSPEQAAGEQDLDGRSDLYSLACVLYEMLTGEPPFTGPTAESVVRQHMVAEPRPVSQLRPAVPPAIADVVTRALAKNPADRFSPAAHFASALAPAASAVPSARPQPSRVMLGVAGAAILVAVAAVVVLARRPGAAVTIGRTSQVTRDPGLEVDPALSPDGTSIAYAAGPTNAMQVYVRQVSGGRPVPLTSDTTDNFRWPRWSPDGSQIAYQSNDGIYVVPSLGGAPRRVVRLDAAARSVHGQGSVAPLAGFDWSPDGTRIAWVAGFNDSTITIVTLAGGEAREVSAPLGAFAPAWSPDGQRIALAAGNPAFIFGTGYFGNSGATSIWVVPVDGSRPTQVTADTALNLSPQWSPDGRDLYWVSDHEGSRDVYLQRLRGGVTAAGAPRRLTVGSDAQGLSVSRGSGRLAYSRLSLWSSIWSIPIPTRGPVSIRGARQVTARNETIEDLDVSPDGRWLAFDSDRSGNAELYVMPAAGGEARQITTDPAGDYSPDWSPDGRRILFHSLRGGTRDIYTVDADGTGLHRWTSAPTEELDPDWGADGETVLYEVFGETDIGPQHGFATLRLVDGASPEFLAADGDFAHWSLDGKAIAYHAHEGIRVRRVETGAETLLVSKAADGSEPFYVAWSPDGRRLYYLTRSASGWTIRSVAATGGRSTVLVTFDDPTRQQTKYGFCTDGKMFYFTLGSPESDIYAADLERP